MEPKIFSRQEKFNRKYAHLKWLFDVHNIGIPCYFFPSQSTVFLYTFVLFVDIDKSSYFCIFFFLDISSALSHVAFFALFLKLKKKIRKNFKENVFPPRYFSTRHASSCKRRLNERKGKMRKITNDIKQMYGN